MLVSAALLAALIAGIALGPARLPLSEVLGAFTGEATPVARLIVLDVRAPRTITACLAGAALGVTGLQMQTLFRNPLADPYILGISSGASLGVALVVLVAGASGSAATLTAGLGLGGDLAVTMAAGLGSAAVMALVLAIGRFVRSSVTLLLLGVMIGYLTSAAVTVLLSGAAPELISNFVRWQFGSYHATSWANLRLLTPLLTGLLLLSWAQSKSLNALLLGDRYAQTLGVRLRRTRAGIVASSSVLAGTITAFCGPIQFLGLAVPHLARGIFNTSNHRILVPGCALLGATLALTADILAGLPGDEVLPLNAVNAVFGAPVVIWILLRRRTLAVD